MEDYTLIACYECFIGYFFSQAQYPLRSDKKCQTFDSIIIIGGNNMG